ncbi:GntR family transcriptional regulator [Bacillus oleivorans]|uniref:GntR family transcriptional regulator n=1 Tax=Bacillus oleivorans TaxID=1448271 RepID=A0A285D777_9BACI|nr:GntR family transcriptional regulator [Bacillus oleivorans]SNX75505.1 GntR family transcriptional regulator [Bacillus oleivorans]
MFQSLKTKDILYIEIKEKIITGILEPDTPVVEDILAEEFEVSRTPLREALQRLELEGWLVRRRNGRLKVSSISVSEVIEIFQVRGRLEGLVASEAAKRATEDEIKELEMITNLIVNAAEQDQRSDVVRFGSEFHSLLYKISKHKTATKMLAQLNDHINRYRRLGPIRNSKRGVSAANEHQQIFEFLARRDYENCGRAMEMHIINSMNSAAQSIEEYLHSRQLNELEEDRE